MDINLIKFPFAEILRDMSELIILDKCCDIKRNNLFIQNNCLFIHVIGTINIYCTFSRIFWHPRIRR